MRLTFYTLLFVFPVCSAHAKSWLAEACEAFLRGAPPQPNPGLENLARSFASEVHRENRFSAYQMHVGIKRLDHLVDKPTSVVIEPALNAAHQWVSRPAMKMFVHPRHLADDWNDESPWQSDALLVWLQDVEVRSPRGVVRLMDLILEKALHMRDRNPQLDFSLRFTKASQFPDLPIEEAGDDHMVVSVEGHLKNYQAKRLLLVALQYASEVLATDPKYVKLRE